MIAYTNDTKLCLDSDYGYQSIKKKVEEVVWHQE